MHSSKYHKNIGEETMKKKNYLMICLIFLLLLFGSMMFSPDPTNSKVDHQTSNFDSTIQGGNIISDGNIEYEIKYDYEGNKLSNLNANISNKVTNIFTQFFNFIKKIIKKIVS